jgi:hypothetical protein
VMDICGDVSMQGMAPRGRRACGAMGMDHTDGEMGGRGPAPASHSHQPNFFRNFSLITDLNETLIEVCTF